MAETPYFNDPGPQAPTETPYFTDTTRPLAVAPEVLQRRAEKYDTALGPDSPGSEQLAANIQTGDESVDRIKAANREAVKVQALKMQMIDHMAGTGTEVTPQMQDFVMGLTKENIVNPDTILEKQYARTAVQSSLLAGDSTVFDKGLNEHPDATHQALNVGEDVVARKEAFQRITEDTEATYNAANPATKVISNLETWIPGVPSLILGTADSELSPSGVLPGTIKQDFIRRLYSLPVDDAQKEFKTTIDGLMSNNPLLAVELAQAVMKYSSSDEHLDNAFAIADVATAVPIGATARVLGKGAKFAKELATGAKAAAETPQAVKAVKDTVKAFTTRTTDPIDTVAAAGHTEIAAVQSAVREQFQKLEGGLKSVGPKATFDLMGSVPAIIHAQSWAEKPGRTLTLEVQRRLADRLDETTADLLSAVNSGIRIDRLSPEQLTAAAMEALPRTVREYPHLADRVLPGTRPTYSPTTNTHYINVQIGDEGATLFKTKGAAEQFAEAAGLKGTKTVEQQGTGFYLELPQPVDETAPIIRNVPLEAENTTPRSLSNTILGWIKTPEETLSKEARADRVASVYGPGELLAKVRNSASRISELEQGTKIGNYIREKVGVPAKKERQDLFDFIEADRVHESTVNGKTEVGRFATNWGDFEDRWFQQFGKAPTEKQALAYAEYVRISDLDWVFRDLGIYAGKSRLGIKNHTFGVVTTDPQGTKSTYTFKNVEAKSVENLPYEAKDDAGILILRDSGSQFVRKNAMTTTQKELVEHLKGEGYRIFQVPSFGEQALKKNGYINNLTGEDTIHYVISNRYDIKPLGIKQLPKRPGGHLDYPDGYYVSQADITQNGLENVYRGDKNVWQFTNQAKGKKFADALEKVRIMMRDGTDAKTLDEFIAKNLPKHPAAIKQLFLPQLDDAGKVIAKPALNPDHPIHLRFSGESLADTQDLASKYANFKDARKDPFNLYSDVNFEYAGKRNPLIDTVEEIGSEANPIFNLKPAKLTNAMVTMNRAMRKITESRYLDDLKIKEVERIVREFGDQFDVAPEELARNPLQHVYDPKWKPTGSDLASISKNQAARQAVVALKQFLGADTKEAKVWRAMKQRLLNSVYENLGEGKVLDFLEPRLLSTTNDPLKYMRAVAFHSKLGLFNPVQLFLQAQSFIHVAALAGPTTASKAGAGFALMRFMRFTQDPKIIEAFAQRATKLGWKKEDFMEAYTHMRESGMDRVGGEVAMRDDFFDPQLVQTATGKFMGWGSTFFNEGERSVRMSAYNAAYLEWRAANPLAKFSNKVAKDVLQRADLMSINMTRAANGSWQKGFASIPTQFFSYQARLAEQLLGKRLTGAERARAIGAYSLMYGLPVGLSAYTGVWPWGDTIRSELISRGISYDDNVVTKTMMDGIASVALEAATGTRYNVGERYGPGGIDAIHDAFVGSKPFSELLIGVSGVVVRDMVKAFWPVVGSLAGVISGDEDAPKLLAQDMLDFSTEFSTGSQAMRMYLGINYHKYITKNEINMGELEAEQPYFLGITGLKPQAISDHYLRKDILRDMDSMKEKLKVEARKNFQRAIRSDDPDTQQKFFKRGQLAIEGGDMNYKDRAEVFRQSLSGYRDAVSQTEFDFAQTSQARMNKYLKDHAK